MSVVGSQRTPSLVCKLDNSKTLLNVLQSLHIGKKDKDQTAICIITDGGLKFTVQTDSKDLQANAWVHKNSFRQFNFHDSHLQFGFSLSVLVECLQLFMGNAALMVSYPVGPNDDLSLVLEEDGAVTECKIRTLMVDDAIDFRFRDVPLENSVVVLPEYIREAVADLGEVESSSPVTLLMSQDPPHMSLAVNGVASSCQVEFPLTSDVFKSFDCKKSCSNNYRLGLLQLSLKALAASESLKIRTNENGVLSFQHILKSDSGQSKTWVEFLILPEESSDPFVMQEDD